MGFFDTIGKKATEVYQGAKDKTTQISNEMKLKSKLSDEKDKIESLYEKIGKMVYKEFSTTGEGFSNEISNVCREVTLSKQNVDNINKELLLLKDMITCSSCGENIPKESGYCLKCGSAIAKEGIILDTKKEQ